MRPPGPPSLRSARPADRGRCNPVVYAGQRRNTCLGMSRFLPAYWAEGRAALWVIALPEGRLPDPVSPLGRDGPATRLSGGGRQPQSACLRRRAGGGINRPAGGISRRYHPAGHGLDGTGARQSGRRPVRGVGTLVTSETAV